MNPAQDVLSAAHRESKQPRTILAGPYGHPFHALLVTIPIGTWIASIVFDVVGFFVDDPRPFTIGAMVLIAIGLVGALAAAAVGLLDLSRLAKGTAARRTALVHMSLNLAAMALFTVNVIVRVNADQDSVSVLGFILSLIALGALGVSGWLGGKLAYHYGVRVADEGTQSEGFDGPARHGR